MDKALIVADIRHKVRNWQQKNMPDLDLSKACFYYHVLAQEMLRQHLGTETRILVSAGSFSFPRINLALDDGFIDTHFSYMWNAKDPRTIDAISRNEMPEMHIWLAMPDRGEIFDITTCYLRSNCEIITGNKWLAPNPPDFIWCRLEDLPPGVVYKPDPTAVQYVIKMIKYTWRIP